MNFSLENKFHILFQHFRDLTSIYKEPPPGICVVNDAGDITKVQFRILLLLLDAIN